MAECTTVTAELLEYMAYFYANTDRYTLERDGLIAEGKSGETGWKRFSHNFDIFILKLGPEKRAVLADLITRFICPHPDDLAVDRFAAAMKAKLAAQERVAVPDGWVLVPEEPSKEMCGAGCHASEKGPDEIRPSTAATVYRAMIAAAAPAPYRR